MNTFNESVENTRRLQVEHHDNRNHLIKLGAGVTVAAVGISFLTTEVIEIATNHIAEVLPTFGIGALILVAAGAIGSRIGHQKDS